MQSKVAIITGITGQDGAYLSKLLLQKGYTIIGVLRTGIEPNTTNLKYLDIHMRITYVHCNLLILQQVKELLIKYAPNEVYNLAAQSSVSQSFAAPINTIEFNIISVANMLEGIRSVNQHIKFYQASSSEMFGMVHQLPVTEHTIFHPLSPYAISKVAAHYLTINYRESYNMYTCCGILFNHESYLRANNFFIKKLLKGALNVLHNHIPHLEFGNLNIKRDFGLAQEYVEAMYLMMQQEKPDDYLICSGSSILLSDIVYYVFNALHINTSCIKINSSLYRPTDIEDMYGDNAKALKQLNWNCTTNFYKALDALIIEEQKNYNLG